jgi:hypothetical protein
LPFDAFSISEIIRSTVNRWFGLPEVEKALNVSLIGSWALEVAGASKIAEIVNARAVAMERYLNMVPPVAALLIVRSCRMVAFDARVSQISGKRTQRPDY